MEALKYIVNNSTSIISLIGALSGLLAVGLSICKHFDDKAKLELTANLIHEILPNDEIRHKIQLTFINAGKRPINIVDWYWALDRRIFKAPLQLNMTQTESVKGKLPALLKEAEHFKVDWYFENSDRLENLVNRRNCTIFAVDSTGEKWELNRKSKKFLSSLVKSNKQENEKEEANV